jgi:sulfur carrier protein ThiS
MNLRGTVADFETCALSDFRYLPASVFALWGCLVQQGAQIRGTNKAVWGGMGCCQLVSFILLAAGLGNLSAQAQESRIGTVVATDRNIVYVKTSFGPVTVRVESAARIWKGDDGMDVSAIDVGDEVSMRGITDVDGYFVPSQIWVNIGSLDGVITSVDGDAVDVRVVRNDDANETKRIRLTPKSLSAQNHLLRRQDIRPGRVVRVIGLILKDGTIRASRFIVYVNGRPVDSSIAKYIDPATGRIMDKSQGSVEQSPLTHESPRQ